MPNSYSFPDGDFFDADYFERGPESGKGWLRNYRWMPQRSFREALAVIDTLKLDGSSRLLDVGCAKGFIVRALRELEIKADGCDISRYALLFAPEGCWWSGSHDAWTGKEYTHAFCKDVLEHCNPDQVHMMLGLIREVAPVFMCVVPMGDNGVYRIPEYHTEITHLIIENEDWWRDMFRRSGWRVTLDVPHVPGIKENWKDRARGFGNRVFVMERCDVA